MKILQIIYESFGSPFGFGGAGVRAYEIYKRLTDRHNITLLCMKYPGAKDSTIEGLRHVFVGSEGNSLTKSVFCYTIEAAKFIRKYGRQYDIIVENFLPSTPFFSRFLTKTPVVLQVQGIMEHHSLRKFSPVYAVPMYLMEQLYPLLYSRFIFVSPVTHDKLLARRNKAIISSSIVPNGADESLLTTVRHNGMYILFFSRIDTYTKGLDLLIKAFMEINRNWPDIQLILAGYEFDKAETLISRVPLEVRQRISYAGFVTGDKKTRLIAGAKFIVLPSRHESAPISILEAAACGKALVVSDIPELRFVEEQGFGISFQSGSADGLCEKMKMLLNDTELRERLGSKGRKYAGNYTWDRIAKQFEDALFLNANHSP